MRIFVRLLIVSFFAVMLSHRAEASFIDTTFDAAFYFPDAATPYQFAAFTPQTFVVGSGTETIGDVENVTAFLADLNADKLTITLTTTLDDPTWSWADFNGVIFTRHSPGTLNIASAIVDPMTSLIGFDNSRVSFTDKRIGLNFAGLSYRSGDTITIDFAFNSEGSAGALPVAAIPELGSPAFLSAGILMGIVFVRRLRLAAGRTNR